MPKFNFPKETLSYWILQTIAMLITVGLIPKLKVTNPIGALLTVITLAFVNATIWDAALFFEIPNSFTKQSLTLILINGAIFFIIVKILPWIEVDGLIPAIIAPITFTIFSLIIDTYGRNIDWGTTYESIVNFMQGLKQSVKEPDVHSAIFRIIS